MKLADIDRLNILYFGEMNLPAWARALRAEMAAAFEVIVRKYLQTIQTILISKKSDKQITAALAMAATAFAAEYRRFFDKWYAQYYTRSGGSASVQPALQWRNDHSTELAVWLTETTRSTPTQSIMSRMRTRIRTEINAICNLAMFRALADSGTPYKRWRSHHDGLTRSTHDEADEQVVPIDEPFIVGGYLMMFPLDNSLGAPPQEITNCRCIMEGVNSQNGIRHPQAAA